MTRGIVGTPTVLPNGRTVSTVVTLGERRTLEQGDEFSVAGEGRFRFREHVRTEAGTEWVTAYGPVNSKAPMFRSFSLERVATIHRTVKARGAS